MFPLESSFIDPSRIFHKSGKWLTDYEVLYKNIKSVSHSDFVNSNTSIKLPINLLFLHYNGSPFYSLLNKITENINTVLISALSTKKISCRNTNKM